MAFYTNSEYKGKGFGRPSDDITPPKKEQKPYGLAWAKYIYGSHLDGVTGIPYNWGTKMANLRAYSYGRQNPNLYKKWFAQNIINNPNDVISVDFQSDAQSNVNQARKHYMDVDFDQIFSPAPKYMNYLIGKLSKIEIAPTVQAIDERSGAAKEEKKWATWAKKFVQKDFAEIDQIRGVPPQQEEYIPQTLDELDIYEKMGSFKVAYEVAMEKALQFTNVISQEKRLRKKIVRDIITCNTGAYEVKVDDDGIVKYQYVDPGNLIIEFSDRNVFDSARYYGTIVGYKIPEIRRKFPELEESEIERLARQYVGVYSNPEVVNVSYNEVNGIFGYDEFSIPVLHFAFITVNKQYFQHRTSKTGEKITSPVRYNEDGSYRIRKNDAQDAQEMFYECVYEGKWIVGTELVFDYGKMHDIPYDSRVKRAKLPIQLCKLDGKSMMEQMIPLLDQIQMTYIRLQNAIAKAPPSGLKIDIGKMKKLSMHGRKWGPRDLIKLYTQTGHLLYDSSVTEGHTDPNIRTSDPGKAIEELKGGVGTAISDAIQSFEFCFSAISEITGIDRASVASAQPDRTSAAETKIAAAGSSDTLFTVIDGMVDILQTGAECAALRIGSRCLIDESPYISVIGRSGVEAIKIAGSIPPVYYGVNIEVQPTDDDKAEIKAAAQLALKGGVLSMGQYLFITDCLNSNAGLNYAMSYITMLESRAKEEASKAALANQQMDTQKQMVVASQKSDAEANSSMLKGKIDMDVYTHKTNEDIRKEKELSGLGVQKPLSVVAQ